MPDVKAFAADAEDGATLPTNLGVDLRVKNDGKTITIVAPGSEAKVVGADVEAGNAVIHVRVPLPPPPPAPLAGQLTAAARARPPDARPRCVPAPPPPTPHPPPLNLPMLQVIDNVLLPTPL